MKSSVPRLLRRAAALLFLLVLPVCVAAPGVAWGQYVTSNGSATAVTSTGVRCGDEVISFDTLNLPTEGANTARKKELAKLYAYAKEAWVACEFADHPTEDRLPGCKFVRQWIYERSRLENRHAWDKRELGKRTRLRALDGQLVAQAMRVLAHRACRNADSLTANQSNVGPSPACVALVTAEARAKGAEPCEGPPPAKPPKKEDEKAAATAASRSKVHEFYSTPASPSCPSAASSALDVNDEIERGFEDVGFDQPVIGLLPKTPNDPKPTSPSKPLPPPPAADRTTFEQMIIKYQNDLKHQELVLAWYMLLLDTYVTDLAEYEKLLARLPGVTNEKKAEVAVLKAIEDELRFLRRNSSSDQDDLDAKRKCKDSTYYVTPTGSLIENRDLDKSNPTLCIDTSSFALDQPFEVIVTAYPRYPKLAGRDARTISSRASAIPVKVWPGERTELPMDALIKEHLTDVVRITIRGYPRGISLRSLAQHGTDGTRIDGNYETTDLRVQARKVAESRVILDSDLSRIQALDGIAGAIGKDTAVQKLISEMNTEVDKAAAAPNDRAQSKKAAEAVNAALDAVKAIEEKAKALPANASKPAARAAIEEAINKLPGALKPESASLKTIQEAQQKLKGHQAALEETVLKERGEQKTAVDRRDELNHRLARLCRISKQLLPVVDEDVLIAQTSVDNATPGVYVLDYDYDAGFQRAPTRNLRDSDRVYVRVRRVRPNEAVAIAVGDKGVVQHAVSIVGYSKDPGTPPPNANTQDPGALAGSPRQGINDLKPDEPDIQSTSTQILAFPGFDGAKRYEFILCAMTDKSSLCSTSDQSGKTRIIARNSLVVHSQRRLGIRAGVGFMGSVGEVRSLVDVPNSTLKYVRKDYFTPDAAVPLLLTLYAIPRDAVDMPRGFTWGFGMGPDLVATFRAKPRLYAGFTLDWSGFGLTVGPLLEQRTTINAAAGSYVTNNPEVKRWYFGSFVALTTDFDIFEAVLRKYILSDPSPAIGNGGNSP